MRAPRKMRKIALGRCYDGAFHQFADLDSRKSGLTQIRIDAVWFAHSSKGGYSTHGDRGPQHYD